MVFGCGHDSDVTFNNIATGVIGLGTGPLSLVNQFTNTINGKFSYCLTGFDAKNSRSKINLGDNAVVSGSRVMSTPIIHKKRLESLLSQSRK